MYELMEKYDILEAEYHLLEVKARHYKEMRKNGEKYRLLHCFFQDVEKRIRNILGEKTTLDIFISDVEVGIELYGEKSYLWGNLVVLLQELKEIKKGE